MCQNGGACTDNKCVCPEGYSGNACQNAWSTPAIGTYTCTQGTCTPSEKSIPSWQSVVTKASENGGYTINISNFAGSNLNVTATVDSNGADSVQILQVGTSAEGVGGYGKVTVNSTGTYITFYYYYDANGALGSKCNVTMVKL